MLRNFTALAAITGDAAYQRRAEQILEFYRSPALGNPFAYPGILAGALALIDPIQIVLAAEYGNPLASSLLATAIDTVGPGATITYIGQTEDLPESHPAYGKHAPGGPRLFICRGNTCAAPAATPDVVAKSLEQLRLYRP
jgi:uncharacterized protein YyaL (SSP411 family)